MCQGIIYKATNLINDKCYIGQTSRKFKKRMQEHLNPVKDGEVYFHNALKKYGKENFKWEIIYECDEIMLDMMETFKIMVCHSHYSEGKGYNLTWGGKHSIGMLGKHHTDETKKILSETHSGSNNPFYGKKHTEETKRKISYGGKGRKCSEETRRKISEFRKTFKYTEKAKKKMSENHADMSGINNPMFGRKHTEETKRKIREKRKMQKIRKVEK
jgi:group I intron endonuclease